MFKAITLAEGTSSVTAGMTNISLTVQTVLSRDLPVAERGKIPH